MQTYRTACFEIDLDQSWRRLDQDVQDPGAFVFRNEANGVQLFISGDQISATGRDLLDLAARMNAHVLGTIAAAVEPSGGTLRRDTPRFAETPPGFDVEITAEVVRHGVAS